MYSIFDVVQSSSMYSIIDVVQSSFLIISVVGHMLYIETRWNCAAGCCRSVLRSKRIWKRRIHPLSVPAIVRVIWHLSPSPAISTLVEPDEADVH